MSIYAAIHSNALTYLVNAIGVEGCDPAHDTSGLADERIAMSRLFMYRDCKRIVELPRHGYANDSPMETTKRFPQGFGNLAKNARFPHSHSQDSFW